MTSGLNIAFPLTNALAGNVWQGIHAGHEWLRLSLELFPSSERVWPAPIPWAAIVNYSFFPEHPGESCFCFQVWLEVKLSRARTPLKRHRPRKLLKYDRREDFISTMLLCWDVTGFLPRSGRYGTASYMKSYHFPSLPLPLLFWERSIERKNQTPPKNPTNQNQTLFWNKS